MKVAVYLVKAFTDDPKLGNPAGVVLGSDGLTSDQMQGISYKIGFSESVFVSNNGVMRYFSPTKEVPYCVHATIAAQRALNNSDSIIRIGVGQSQKTAISLKGHLEHIAWLLGASINKIEIIEENPLAIKNVCKVMLRVDSQQTLLNLEPKFEKISEYSHSTGTRGFFIITNETSLKDSDFHARQFNPYCGIDEDPVTGIAGAMLGATLGKNLIIEQGHSMNTFGRMFISVDDDTIHVGGHAVIYDQLEIEI